MAAEARIHLPLFIRILDGDGLAEAIPEGGGQAFKERYQHELPL
jgi:hypothetical protein